MRIQTFRASSIQEALQMVRQSLGPDASVLNARQVRRGLFAKPQIEVEASRDLRVPSHFAPAMNSEESLEQSPPNESHGAGPVQPLALTTAHLPKAILLAANPGWRQGLDNHPQGSETSPASAPVARTEPVSARWVTEEPFRLPRSASRVLSELLTNGVAKELAHELLRNACQQTDDAFHDDEWLIRGQIVEAVARRLSVVSADLPNLNEQRVMAFVGPTASGKTTLLGKIAAQAYFQHQLEIGIVVVDCWRTGNADQLLHLADTVSAKVEAVSSVEQLAAALQRLRECDLVMLDTTGRSANDAVQMRGLHEILQIAQPNEVHLVLESNSAPAYVRTVIERFARSGATRLSISRLDEAVGIGQWLSSILDSGIPLQYMSYGQLADQDLMQPGSRHLASILLGHKSLCSNTTQNPNAFQNS